MQEMELNDKQEEILETLADECERNPQTSLTGLDTRTIGAKVGEYPPIGAMYDLWELFYSGFVNRKNNRWMITQKGLAYVKSHRPQTKSKSSSLRNWLFITLIISITAGLIVAIITGWRPW